MFSVLRPLQCLYLTQLYNFNQQHDFIYFLFFFLFAFLLPEHLVAATTTHATVGILGFLRSFLSPGVVWLRPFHHSSTNVVDQRPSPDSTLQHRFVELLDVCLHLLRITPRSNHTLINAALELVAVLGAKDTVHHMRLERLLCDADSEHVTLLRKRKSLKWQMLLNRDHQQGPGESAATPQKSAVNANAAATVSNTITSETPPISHGGGLLVAPVAAPLDRSFGSSDIEMDSFRGMEMMTDDVMTTGPEPATSMTLSFTSTSSATANDNASAAMAERRKQSGDRDATSLRSQKSTESIGSFTNSLLSHSTSGELFLIHQVVLGIVCCVVVCVRCW